MGRGQEVDRVKRWSLFFFGSLCLLPRRVHKAAVLGTSSLPPSFPTKTFPVDHEDFIFMKPSLSQEEVGQTLRR